MALHNCVDCKEKISRSAITCPNCGAPNNTKEAARTLKQIHGYSPIMVGNVWALLFALYVFPIIMFVIIVYILRIPILF